jgi:hypothetical protein
MQTRFDEECYRKRAQVETVMSMIKRRQGSFCKGKTYWSRCRELHLMVLTHNIMILLPRTTFLQSQSDSNSFSESKSVDGAADAISDEENSIPLDTIGLALSGGGIRSATFCLGILQAMAKSGWLKKVDLLSTVSGGGYIGGFLGKFFDNASPEIVTASLSDSRSREIDWLRSHSNYLSPKGTGDTAFNLVSFWRNLFTIHLVLLIFMFAVFGIANAISYWPTTVDTIQGVLPPLTPISSAFSTTSSTVSPWLTLAELLVWLAVVPLSFAYWMVSEDHNEEFLASVLFATLLLSVGLLFATQWVGCLIVFGAIVLWVILTWKSVRRLEGRGNANSRFHMALGRNFLTNRLSFWAAITLAILAIAIIDLAGRTLSDFYVRNGRSWPVSYGMLGGSISLLGLLPVLRWLADFLASKGEKQSSFVKLLSKIPFLPSALAIALGAILPLVIVATLSHLAFENGIARVAGTLATILALLISVFLGRRSLIQFVNRSSMLTVYGARLARVFLGAVNPQRHRHQDGRNIGHVIEGDDLALSQYNPHEKGGPIHLINVAVNETIDTASQRGIRDRKAENMSIGPAGISISKEFHAVWAREMECIDGSANEIFPVGNLTVAHPFLRHGGGPVEVEELNLREWMGISGAAFSPGMGRGTSLARSLLYTLTNLRIGYWWNSGLDSSERFRIPMKTSTLFGAVKNIFYGCFGPHMLLLAECIGRFGGPWRRHWYLSDGGHFELTGAYELIRRRIPFIVTVDVGADPKNEGQVLAWLSRLTRIDFGAKFEEVSPDDKRVPPEIQVQLGKVSDVFCGAEKQPSKHGVLFEVTFEGDNENASDHWNGRTHCWLLYVRATTIGDEPVDIRNYQFENPDFPNESTLDQFFDEPQWESYRMLGEHIGAKFFV